MTRPSISEGIEEHDITIALTVSQLVLVALAAFILLRVLRSLRR